MIEDDDIRALTIEIRLLREAIQSLSGILAVQPSPALEARHRTQGDRPAPPLPDAMNEFDAAKMLGMGVGTLRGWRMFRKGPPFRKIGRAVRYSRAQLQEWMDRQPGLQLDEDGRLQPTPKRQLRRK